MAKVVVTAVAALLTVARCTVPRPPGDGPLRYRDADAPLVVATLTGLVLGPLAIPHPDVEEAIFRPALERLFARLVEGAGATAG